MTWLPESRRRRGLGRTNIRSSESAARCGSRAASGGSRGQSVSTLKYSYNYRDGRKSLSIRITFVGHSELELNETQCPWPVIVPAGDSDGVELGPEGVAVAVGVPVELVVVLELGLDLLAARVVGVDVQLVGHLEEGKHIFFSSTSCKVNRSFCNLEIAC